MRDADGKPTPWSDRSDLSDKSDKSAERAKGRPMRGPVLHGAQREGGSAISSFVIRRQAATAPQFFFAPSSSSSPTAFTKSAVSGKGLPSESSA